MEHSIDELNTDSDSSPMSRQNRYQNHLPHEESVFSNVTYHKKMAIPKDFDLITPNSIAAQFRRDLGWKKALF